jgi:hypothetical protein
VPGANQRSVRDSEIANLFKARGRVQHQVCASVCRADVRFERWAARRGGQRVYSAIPELRELHHTRMTADRARHQK